MKKVVLKYESREGPEEITIGEDRISFGRGSEAHYRFDDNGISRIHASIYRDGDYIWIIDENSTYGTFVNEQQIDLCGSPVSDGDEIKIGHRTTLIVEFEKPESGAKDEGVHENLLSQSVSSVSD